MKLSYSFLFLICLSLGWAKTIEVCNTCKFESIKAAIAAAKPNDIILIKEGIYKEFAIEIKKPLVIRGEGKVVIDGQEKGKLIHVQADSVTLDNLKLINVGVSYTEDHAAVRFTKSKHFVIKNLVLDNLFFGIYLEKSNYGKVLNNKIYGDAKDEYNSGNGIHLWYSKHIEITGNYIEKTRDGIYFEFADNCLIKHNLSTKNLRYGLHFMFSNNDDYIENEFRDNGAGVAVMFSDYINMYRNKFTNNWGPIAYGLLLKEIYDGEIKDNVFESNTTAIQIEGSTRILYEHNLFKENGRAIYMMGAAYENTYTHNNFMNNSFDVSWTTNLNDNVFTENYWSDYSGYDLNRDGIGDVPFRPVKLFNYVTELVPEAIVLLRSLFVDIINFSEKVSPVFTPDNLMDEKPQMQPFS